MTHKYEQVCWSCGSKDVEPDKLGVKCRSCGATWNEVPKPGGQVLTITDSLGRPVTEATYDRRSKPGPGAIKSAVATRRRRAKESTPENAAGE